MRDIHITFVGIDGWNRAVFKVVNKKIFIGNTDKLFSLAEPEKSKKDAIDWFRNEHPKLVYFGSSFDCEPDGEPFSDDINFLLD